MMPRYVLLSLLLAGISGCAGHENGQSLKRLEYYLRWTRTEFPAAMGSRVQVGARVAELPPEYQNAFSLVLEPDVAGEAVIAEYHHQKVIEPASHRSAQARLGEADYRRLRELASSKLACYSDVELGWAGPAPEILSLDYGERELELYIGGPSGPAGPSAELERQRKRAYLCNPDMLKFLENTIQKMTSGPVPRD